MDFLHGFDGDCGGVREGNTACNADSYGNAGPDGDGNSTANANCYRNAAANTDSHAATYGNSAAHSHAFSRGHLPRWQRGRHRKNDCGTIRCLADLGKR